MQSPSKRKLRFRQSTQPQSPYATSRAARVTPDKRKPDEQTVVHDIKRRARAPVRPRRERQQRDRNDIDDNGCDHNEQSLVFKGRIVRVCETHHAALATLAMTVNDVGSAFVGHPPRRTPVQSRDADNPVCEDTNALRCRRDCVHQESAPFLTDSHPSC